MTSRPESNPHGSSHEAASPISSSSLQSGNEFSSPAPLTGEKLAEAKRYNWQSFQCDLLDRVIDVTFLSVAAFWLARPLDDWLLEQGLTSASARLIAFYVVMTGLHAMISLPLSAYSGHVLEHRYGLSRQSFGRWLGRYIKRHVLTVAFGALITWMLYGIIWNVGAYWWLAAAGAYFVLSILLGQLAPVLILPLFYKIERLNDTTLSDRLQKLSAGTGLSIEGVYRMKMSDETVKANAMLAGLGNTRRVILGDTLLDQFGPEEIEVVFAHEVGHHVHRHVPKLIAFGLLSTLVSFLVCDQLLAWRVTGGQHSLDYSQLPVWSLPFLTLVLTLFSMLTEPLQNFISRHFERQADTYAFRRSGQPQAFRSAFTKLASLNKSDPDPHRWEVILFHSHPPIAERLALGDRLARSQG